MEIPSNFEPASNFLIDRFKAVLMQVIFKLPFYSVSVFAVFGIFVLVAELVRIKIQIVLSRRHDLRFYLWTLFCILKETLL